MYLTNYDPIFNAMRESFFRPLVDFDSRQAENVIPAVDVKEDDKRWTFLVNLPGVKNEDIDISIRENTLSIEAHTLEEHKEERDKYTHVERHEGSYKRSFVLPESANSEAISAKLDNGVLHITVDKKEAIEPKKVTVDVG